MDRTPPPSPSLKKKGTGYFKGNKYRDRDRSETWGMQCRASSMEKAITRGIALSLPEAQEGAVCVLFPTKSGLRCMLLTAGRLGEFWEMQSRVPQVDRRLLHQVTAKKGEETPVHKGCTTMARSDIPFEIPEEEFENIEAAFRRSEESSAPTVSEKFLEKANLDIAVTGESGSGKSTFINAMRGLNSDDEGAAPTGSVETTMEPTPYPYLHRENIKLWDLPGIGTPSFRAETYLQQMDFTRYDFFILVSSERLRENLILLALGIQRMGKQFYIVRSKIDTELLALKRRKKSYDENKILQEIRDSCTQPLEKRDLKCPHIFLLSSLDIGKFDFARMQEVLEKELPKHKRHAFLLSLPNISLSVLQKKKEALMKEIWKPATVSCGIAVLPIPGLSLVCDITILVKTIRGYLIDFGLDDESLRRLAQRVGKPVEVLRAVIKSPAASMEMTPQLLIHLLTRNASGALMTFEYIMSNIPVISGGISFATTYYMLRSILDELAEDANRVLAKSLEE